MQGIMVIDYATRLSLTEQMMQNERDVLRGRRMRCYRALHSAQHRQYAIV
jgi:hypothetical protein